MPDDLDENELGEGALELLRRHFDALNRGDRAALRETVFLFPYVDGLRFELWWEGMRTLTPFDVDLELDRINTRVRERRADPPARHVSIWVKVTARSHATGTTYQDYFAVWYLLNERTWKLACRFHWYQ